MKRLATFVFAMLLTGGLAFAQGGGGKPENPVNRATPDTGKDTDKKKAHKGGKKGHKGGSKKTVGSNPVNRATPDTSQDTDKKGHKGGKKSKNASTPNPPTTK